MITIDKLLAFSPVAWQLVVALWRARARAAASNAATLRLHAAAIRQHWAGPVGDAIAALVEKQADALDKTAITFAQAADRLEQAAQDMQQLQSQLAAAVSYTKQIPGDYQQDGRVSLPLPYYLDLPHLNERLAKCRAAETRLVQILHTATFTDYAARSDIAKLFALNLPWLGIGPIPMDDAAIREQARLNQQGDYGHCAWLSPLMSIGMSDPEFIRKHVHYNPATGKYEVQLYDKDTGKPLPPIEVDPDTFDPKAGGIGGPPREPSYLTIYQLALRQQYPNLQSTNFPEAIRMITGKKMVEHPASQTSFDDIRKTLGTTPPGAVMVAIPGKEVQDHSKLPEDKKLAGNSNGGHAYAVKGFDEHGRIVLVNPWGPQGAGGIPGEVHLTEEEYRRWCGGVGQVQQPF